MSQLISRATSELQSLVTPANLGTRTLGTLPTTIENSRSRVLGIVAGICLVAIVVGLVLLAPQIATARAVSSIQEAIEAKVRHTRQFHITDGKEILGGERWDHRNFCRRESYLPEYQPDTLRSFAKPTGKSVHVETVITDGKRLLRLAHQLKRAYQQSYTSKYVVSGFDLDSVLRDMGGRQNLQSVQIETKSIDDQEVLVAKFANKLANYTLYCDAQTRLPFKMEIVRPPLFTRDVTVRNVYYYTFSENVEPQLFSMDVPEGYRLSDPH